MHSSITTFKNGTFLQLKIYTIFIWYNYISLEHLVSNKYYTYYYLQYIFCYIFRLELNFNVFCFIITLPGYCI